MIKIHNYTKSLVKRSFRFCPKYTYYFMTKDFWKWSVPKLREQLIITLHQHTPVKLNRSEGPLKKTS